MEYFGDEHSTVAQMAVESLINCGSHEDFMYQVILKLFGGGADGAALILKKIGQDYIDTQDRNPSFPHCLNSPYLERHNYSRKPIMNFHYK